MQEANNQIVHSCQVSLPANVNMLTKNTLLTSSMLQY